MRKVWHENSLSIVMFGLFAVFLLGQLSTGLHVYNQEQREHGQPAVGYAAYARSGQFIEAVFENWESEFLQMGVYVLFTAFLYQKGSAESKAPDEPERVDADPRASSDDPGAPGPVRRGGWRLKLYEYSLSLSLLTLFALSFGLHAVGSMEAFNAEQAAHGAAPISLLRHLGSAQFWFESLQNWQSEFLSVGAIVVLSIWLRQRGSPESKPVAAPHGQTGA